MVEYKIVLSDQACKDLRRVQKHGLQERVEVLFTLLKENPFQKRLPFKKLQGELMGCYSRRITFKHRLVFEVFEEEKVVKVVQLWTHKNRVFA